eukprot:CAMPEP_0205821278 /NCGR_PEP_ID=MMETSP0206-20130828/6313_1 /ASSEMBLY_ACC=CAM_ASM_000279 /TAXON_ID=36767 /ORGANISM="Euplotes focardii, Strain TN1" /LENGTH=641 /DNA_ID=CAMNT_0053116635 /DNA_START=27 /DNA_END=1952 /DNA_ORIENTATION=+
MARGVLLLLGIVGILGDTYMHNPRGCNNRLNEKSANRNNGNRLFDSQNNNRGGHNVGDRTDEAFSGNNPEARIGNQNTGKANPDLTFNPADDTKFQYQMVFYEGSELSVEWTNQHGCGGREHAEGDLPADSHKLNCNFVMQYMCESADSVTDPGMQVRLRDGGNTNTPNAANAANQVDTTRQANDNNQRGRHESEGYYFECTKRSRNKGLFLADQNVKGQSAQYTRQNPNANRRGLECPEERDYYPYWSPSPWVDVAYYTDTLSLCPFIEENSQNNNEIFKCTAPYTDAQINNKLAPITEQACIDEGGIWTGFTHGVAAPECVSAGWSRENQLGNGRDGQPLTYNWTLPAFDDITTGKTFGASNNYKRCVLRLRYNISTDDYDPWNANASMNYAGSQVSPVTQNPTVDVGANLQGLRLAINTAQFGRTFQDRSHVFYIKKRPAAFVGKTIWNLNVRGKRGNIVQTYPAVEYDFVPNQLTVQQNTLMHIQWTGSNTHNNGNPAGDGQAGDAGEGKGGTDRNNFVQTEHPSDNYPIPLDKYTDNIWTQNQCYKPDGTTIGSTDCALIMATSGQYWTVGDVDDDDFNTLLDDAPASLIGGILIDMTTVGNYNYMCTRNNNFSNRSQKGSLKVTAEAPTTPNLQL